MIVLFTFLHFFAEAPAAGRCWSQGTPLSEPALLLQSNNQQQYPAGSWFACFLFAFAGEEVAQNNTSPECGATGNETAAPPYLARLLVKYTQSCWDWAWTIKPHSLPLDIVTAMADKVADLQQHT